MLIYDGDCGFCTSAALWVVDRSHGAVTAQPWQALDLDELGLTPAEVSSAAYWIDDDGRLHRGHAAIARSLEALGAPYRPAGLLLRHAPVSWLARPAYWLVARYRHRMPGASNACRLD